MTQGKSTYQKRAEVRRGPYGKGLVIVTQDGGLIEYFKGTKRQAEKRAAELNKQFSKLTS